jgi:hypothetical protein
VPDGLAKALEGAGIVTGPLSDSATAKVLDKGVSPDDAAATAESTYGFVTKDPPEVYLASVTVLDLHVGDDETPLAIDDRPAYVVQMTGLDILANGGPPVGDKDAAPMPHHSEMDVLIDAMTGDLLMGTTFR